MHLASRGVAWAGRSQTVAAPRVIAADPRHLGAEIGGVAVLQT
jgi:hypothetical protein